MLIYIAASWKHQLAVELIAAHLRILSFVENNPVSATPLSMMLRAR